MARNMYTIHSVTIIMYVWIWMCLSLTCMGLRFIQMENQRARDGFSGSVHLAWIAKYNLKLFWLHHDEVCLCCPMRSSTHVLYHIGHVLGLGQSENKKLRWNEGRKLVSNTHSTMTDIFIRAKEIENNSCFVQHWPYARSWTIWTKRNRYGRKKIGF